jgi:hypothetical protein
MWMEEKITMDLPTKTNDNRELYAPEEVAKQVRLTPAGRALGHLADAWKALEALEASLPDDLERWDSESLIAARKGAQRAWLALSNLNNSLNTKRLRSQDSNVS